MRKRFRLLAAVNVLLWLVTLVLPQTATISLAHAATAYDAPPAIAECVLAFDSDDLDAKRAPRHRLPPLATIAAERHGHLLVALPHHASDFVSPPAAPRDLTARPQTIATRFSFVFEACGPPPGQPIH